MTHRAPFHLLPFALRLGGTLLIVAGAISSAAAATSISQFGISWKFDADRPTGQFANGDFWVVGPVRITSITPRSTSRHGVVMHGSMINPSVNSSQGYDSRIKNNPFSADANVGDLLPLVLPPGTSLLSSESYKAKAHRNAPQLKTIAILTVLSAPAPAGSFRPPYIGSDKTVRWSTKSLDWGKLRTLRRVPNTPSLANIERNFERPWIEQKTNWAGRFMHPAENQPAYGREMAHVLARGLLSLQLDYSPAAKKTLLVRLVQYGIDVYGAAKAGAKWSADGGHNQGRKMPLLLAASLLNDRDMLSYADAQQHLIFQEDQQTWFVSPADVGRSLHKKDGRPRVSYAAADVGMAEWGEKHSRNPTRDGRNWDAYYRTVSGSCTVGHVLTAKLMGLERAWNWPAIFDYYERYWSHESYKAGHGANTIPAFVAQLWRAHVETSPGETFSDENVATKIWQNIAITPQVGSFVCAFDLLPSSNQMDGVTGLSEGAAEKYSDMAAAVRFAPSGVIDARDGHAFKAAHRLKYKGGVKYRVVMMIDLPRQRYSVSVTPPEGNRVVIAHNWEFRTPQAAATRLDHLGFHAKKGYHAVLNLNLPTEPSRSL